MKGLLLTDEVRKELQIAVEEAIACHFSAESMDTQIREREARKERIHLYKETQEACEAMNEQTAKELLFSKYTDIEVVKLYKKWERRKEEELENNYFFPVT
jgi:hypothetical protein